MLPAVAPKLLTARWLLPISSAPIEFGAVVVEGCRIKSVGRRDDLLALWARHPQVEVRDYGESIILPGLINLHTHLDYTNLRHFDTESAFLSWIRALVASSWRWSAKEWRESALYGARQLAKAGTTCAVDASYSGAAAFALAEVGLRGIVGLELFGIDESKACETFASWLDKYEAFRSEADGALAEALEEKRIRLTCAPHTPFTVCPSLLTKALDWTRAHAVPMLLHVAESDYECRWIESGVCPELDEFLAAVTGGAVPQSLDWRGQGRSPVQHLEAHGLLADNLLAAHLVKLSDDDLQLVVAAGAGAAHCPRSNSRLRNGTAPFQKMAERGLEVGFGTDSAASSDDLDVLAEARFAFNLQRGVSPDSPLSARDVVHYLTLGAARAAGLALEIGSLEEGKLADISVFSLESLPEVARGKPFESLVCGGTSVQDVFVNGRAVLIDGEFAGQAPLEMSLPKG